MHECYNARMKEKVQGLCVGSPFKAGVCEGMLEYSQESEVKKRV